MSIGLSIPLENGPSGYFKTSDTILDQIKNNFINLILTIPGERFNNPEFGCEINNLVFNFNDDELTASARVAVQKAVERWMPYLELEEFIFQPTNEDIDQYKAQMYVKYRLSENPNLGDEVLIQF